MENGVLTPEEMLDAAFYALQRGATLKEVLIQMFQAGEIYERHHETEDGDGR